MRLYNTSLSTVLTLIDLAFGTQLGFVSLTDIDNQPSHSVQFGNCILLLGDKIW